MNMIERKLPNANLDIGAVRKSADGLDTHANSDVPSIAPQSIQDQCTKTISLSEQLLDEWNHRLKNDLQILVRVLESGYRKARSSEAREVLSDAIRRTGAIGTAQRAYYCARGSTDVNGQDLVNAVCANARPPSVASGWRCRGTWRALLPVRPADPSSTNERRRARHPETHPVRG